jgi:uncharacterized protein YecE (DUF72 family)
MRRPYVCGDPLSMTISGKLYIGTSGFSYDHWADGVFYPKVISRKEWLSYYAARFNSVELNMTFFKVPEKESFVEWQSQVPAEFQFSVKGYNYITHLKKLTGISEPLRFLMDRVTKLKDNLSCILWEIPSLGSSRAKLLEGFINHLKKYPKIRHAFDLKDPALQGPEVIELVLKNKMAVVETEENLDWFSKTSALPFRYVRLKGEELKKWEKSIQASLKEGQTCYLYFTQEAQGKAIRDAKTFLERMKNTN